MISKKSLKFALLGSVAALVSLVTSNVAFAQDTPSAEASDEAIIVIGTRRTDRTLTNSPSPVDVISASELTSQPAANMLDVVKSVIPSFYVGQNTISDASTFTRAPSLRGLPGDEVLVMLNGKRYNRAALVQVYTGGDTGLSFGSQGSDISAIPSIAIQNLQVLRDGATAQYGSDAIAGVLNYGLKSESSGLDLQARYGEYYEKDGESTQLAANIGIPLGSRGFVNLSGEYFEDEQTSRGATRPVAVAFAQQFPNLANQLPNYPDPVQIWGSSPAHGYKFLLNSGFDVTANSQLYFFLNAAKSNADQSFNYRSPISATAVDSNGVTRTLGANGAFNNTFYLTPCPAATATCPAGGFVQDTNTFRFVSVYPAGFTPRFLGESEEMFGVLGYKGEFDSGLTYDVSVTSSENSLSLSMNQSLNASYGPQSQTSFEFGDLIQEEEGATLDMTYPLQVGGLASPITLSGGAEWRKETYTQTAGDVQSYGVGPYALPQQLYSLVSPGVYAPAGQTTGMSPGASGYGGTSPEAAGSWSQESYGVYFGAEADITDKLSAGVAGRYEHYSTFGETTVGKINAIYHLMDSLAIRGTVGTGFHAPSPGQSNVQILTTNFVAGNQVQTGTYPVTSPISLYYGSSVLSPAESTNYGVGIVAEPTGDMTITVDAYQIDVENRIGISQNFEVTAADIANEPALIAVGEGGNVNYFTNGFDTSTKGVDVVATNSFDLAGADLALTLAYNYNKTEVTQFDPTVIGPAQIITAERLAPNHRANFNVNWSLGSLSINGRVNYYGSWINENDYPGQEFGSKVTADLDVSLEVAENYTISVGAQNITDEYPDRIAQTAANNVYPITGSLADGQVYPRNGGPFGINGGFWYVRLRAAY